MNIAKMHLSLGALVLLGGGLFAQNAIQSTLLRDHVWSQSQQPANIVEGEYNSFRYGAQGSFWLANSHATLDGIFAENGFITEDVKDRLLSQLKAKEDISGGYNLNLASVNVKLGELPLGFYLDENASIYTRFNNPHTLGLILKGNGAYAGDTVSDQDISAKFVRTRELGIGTGWKLDKLSLGVRLRLKEGIKMADLDHLNYSLYTETNGTQVHAQADYDLFMTPKMGKAGMFAFQGFGAGIDFGMRYQLSEKLELDAAVNDIGFTSWQTNNMADEVDVQWEGIEIASLLQDSISQIVDEQVDSVRGLLLPDTVKASHLLLAPTSVRANVTWHISERAQLSGSVVYYPLAVGQRTSLPLVGVSYRHEVIDGLVLGASAYGLGQDMYGFGALANYEFSVGSAKLDIMVGSDNLLGLLVPSVGRGMNAFGGVGVAF